ncbi:MAG: hypothetical protein Q4D54_04555, partial [Eubacteriales bacterium]|nr:hypothetical protein [Eubacteriales bacterium]
QPKAPKEASGKMKTGAKVYIIISIVLILALTGVGIWGFLTYTKQIDDLKKDKKELEIQVADHESTIDGLEMSVENKDDEITVLEDNVESLQNLCTDYEEQLNNYAQSTSEYAAYDNLIQFADSSIGQGYTDFFASDTVIHLTGGEVAVKLYFAHQGNVLYTCDDSSVVSCQWSDSFEDNVASLYISPVGSGNTKITISNDVNDEEIVIYVYVD